MNLLFSHFLVFSSSLIRLESVSTDDCDTCLHQLEILASFNLRTDLALEESEMVGVLLLASGLGLLLLLPELLDLLL